MRSYKMFKKKFQHFYMGSEKYMRTYEKVTQHEIKIASRNYPRAAEWKKNTFTGKKFNYFFLKFLFW